MPSWSLAAFPKFDRQTQVGCERTRAQRRCKKESDKQPPRLTLHPGFCGFCKYFSRLSQSTQLVVWLNGSQAQKKGNTEVRSVAWGQILMSPNSDPSWCKISVQLFPGSILKSFTQSVDQKLESRTQIKLESLISSQSLDLGQAQAAVCFDVLLIFDDRLTKATNTSLAI